MLWLVLVLTAAVTGILFCSRPAGRRCGGAAAANFWDLATALCQNHTKIACHWLTAKASWGRLAPWHGRIRVRVRVI